MLTEEAVDNGPLEPVGPGVDGCVAVEEELEEELEFALKDDPSNDESWGCWWFCCC